MNLKADAQKKKAINLLDIFLIGLVLLTLTAVYLTFIKPVKFSNRIIREAVSLYAEVDFVLADDLEWMAGQFPEGLEYKNVYGDVDWKILNLHRETLNGRPVSLIRIKLLTARDATGLLRYGKYTLVRGGRIVLINDDFFIEGRIYQYRLLDEKLRL